MVEIKNLTKYYGHNCAVKGISFDIRDGEILGFLGPNGAGKSTTMNMIAGYLPSTMGTVTVNGLTLRNRPPMPRNASGISRRFRRSIRICGWRNTCASAPV